MPAKTHPPYVAVEWTDVADGTTARGQVVSQRKTVAAVTWPNGHTEKSVKLNGKAVWGTLRFITLDEDHAEALAEDAARGV